MADQYSNESIGGLIRGIFMDLRQLMREEIALARVEIREQAGRAKAAALALGAAVAALAFGGIFLLIALAQGVADVFDWPMWAGFFVVALLLSVAGAVLLTTGRRQLRQVHAVPEQTVETLKENSEWIAKRLSSERR
jgi:uncharacterized membrane protein YqjE